MRQDVDKTIYAGFCVPVALIRGSGQIMRLTGLIGLLVIAACSRTSETPTIPTTLPPGDEGATFSKPIIPTEIPAPDFGDKGRVPLLVLLPPESVVLAEARKDIQDGALMAYASINDERLSILFADDDRPFANLGQEPRGRLPLWPSYKNTDLLAIIGPYGSEAAERFVREKPDSITNFALTNDSKLGRERSFVVGLTPEQQAAFTTRFIPWRIAGEQLEFRPMLANLGFGILPELKESLASDDVVSETETDDTSSEALESLAANDPLPILVMGYDGDPFFKRYIQALNTVLAWADSVPGATDQPNKTPKTGAVFPAYLGPDKSSWADTVQDLLDYPKRQKEFQNRLALVDNKAIRELLEKQEILEPAPFSAVVLLVHTEADVTWLASLVEFYNNSWQRMPIFGVESWGAFPDLSRETSLRQAQFPRRIRDEGLDKILNKQFQRLYGRPPSLLAKQVYDLVAIVHRLWQDKSRDGATPLDVSRQGWAAYYQLDPRGFVVPDLEMVTYEASKTLRVDPPRITTLLPATGP